MYRPTTLHDVRDAFAPLRDIKRPAGDNEGDPLDAPSVYDRLPPEHQDWIDFAKETGRGYVLDAAGDVNRRAVTALCRSGFPTSIGPDQYDALRNVGHVQIGDWRLTLSDPSSLDEG